MNFRDKINNTIQNAANEKTQLKQELLQQGVDGVCNWVKCKIELLAQYHSDPNIPFKVNMYFACNIFRVYTRHTEPIQRSSSQTSGGVEKLTLPEDVLTQEIMIREQLKSDGIIVGKWNLYEGYVSDSNDVQAIPAYYYPAEAFGVYKENEIRQATLINFDPYKPLFFTTQKGLWSTSYTLSQGGKSFRLNNSPLQLYLIMPISFS